MIIMKCLMHKLKTIFLLLTSIFAFSNLHSQASKIYYVGIDGNDGNPGSLTRPFKTLDAALLATKQCSFKDVSILMRRGIYSLSKGLVITQSTKSGPNKITITNYKNESVYIIGGKRLDNSKFLKVKTQYNKNRISANAKNEIYQTDLSLQGISEFGTMKSTGLKSPQLPSALELFYNDMPLTLARWPNNNFLAIGKVLPRNSSNNMYGFMFDSKKPSNWSNNPDKWIGGIFAVGYAYDNLKVDSMDNITHSLYFTKTPSYGFYSSTDESSGDISTAKKLRGFYFYNILEELDTPGEWYLDRQSKMLYLWPISPLNSANIEVSILEEPLISITNCTNINISIKSINFSCTRGVAIKIEKSSSISIEKCRFSNTGLQAISANFATSINIINCTFSHTGCGAINISGGDRKQLTSSNNYIRDCNFYDYSRLYKTYSPAVNLNGVGNSILNCYIHDAPDQAITFGGNNHIISYNHIKHVCYGFSDMGSIYTGRDPSAAGTIISNNFFEDIQDSIGRIAAVYIDDGSGGMNIEQNIFYNAGSGGFGAVHVNGGSDNKFDNNIFINCIKAFSYNPWGDEQWKQFYIRNKIFVKRLTETVDIRSDTYLKQYPYLKGFFDTTLIRHRVNNVNNTICYNVKILFTGSGYTLTNTLSTNIDPGFSNIANFDFNLKSIPNQVNNWKNWKPVEFDKIRKQ